MPVQTLAPILLTISAALALSRGPAAEELPSAPTALSLRARPAVELLQLAGQARAELDPGLALDAARALGLRAMSPREELVAWVELGRGWLLAGEAELALHYADGIVARDPASTSGWSLRVRALLRAGRATEALRDAERALFTLEHADFELRAAHAAALYRNQRMQDAERLYRALLLDDPSHPETLIRLGSGLLPAGPTPLPAELRTAIEFVRRGERSEAERRLLRLIDHDAAHPIPLRLLGELELQAERQRSPLGRTGFAPRLWRLLRAPGSTDRLLRRFVPTARRLGPGRRAVVERALGYFEPWLPSLELRGARHDILLEHERTTDDLARAFLRGKRTFDGRYWDDVRGMGGLIAATGVEALDESEELGFDTLLHELAHQVHLYAFSRLQKTRITELYLAARESGRCLDGYARSHETEYFAQGVEAFFSFAKCAGQPRTHGHTRFELMRVDPELHGFLEGLFERDPLRGPARQQLLGLALEAALQTGRCADARTILELQGGEDPATRHRLRRLQPRYETL